MTIEEYELLEREIDKELENISGNTIDNKAVQLYFVNYFSKLALQDI